MYILAFSLFHQQACVLSRIQNITPTFPHKHSLRSYIGQCCELGEQTWKWHVNQISIGCFQAQFANNYWFDLAPQLTKDTRSICGAGNQLFKCSCVWRVEGKARCDYCALQRGSVTEWFHTTRASAVKVLTIVFTNLCSSEEENSQSISSFITKENEWQKVFKK